MISLIAIGLSFGAYQSTQKIEATVANSKQPNIILANITPYGLLPYDSAITDGNYVVCIQGVRLQNAGGSATSLTGFDLVVANGSGQNIQLSNEYGDAHIIAYPDLLPEIGEFYAYLFPDTLEISRQTFGIFYELDLPVQLEPFSAVDLQAGLLFFIDSSLLQALNDTSSNQSLLVTLITV